LKIIETEKIHRPIFFSFNKKASHYLKQRKSKVIPLETKSRGIFRRARALHKNISKIKKHLNDKNIFYINRLDLIYTNVIIGTLNKSHNIEVRIVPEGTINYSPEDASVKWEYRAKKKWPSRISYGVTGLRIYPIEGERIGTDTPIVSTAYSFSGLESPYPKSKVKYISLPDKTSESDRIGARKALVVGQCLLKNSKTPKEVEHRISNEIENKLSSLGVTEIHYIAHPRDEYDCLFKENYKKIEHDYVCLEQYLEQNEYDVLISCCSTVLLTAKLIFGDRIDSISVGANIYPQALDSISTIFRVANVDTIDLDSVG
ncbi:hypothetical protein A3741_29055, partial [Oleiphilus sp. HI0069]